MIDTAGRDFGRLDTLVNNAGIFIAKPFTDYTAEDYRALIGVNLTGFVTTAQLAIARMLRQGDGGHVVQVTTSLVDHANSNVPSVVVSLTKGGLQSATKSLAIEFAKQGVRVKKLPAAAVANAPTARVPAGGSHRRGPHSAARHPPLRPHHAGPLPQRPGDERRCLLRPHDLHGPRAGHPPKRRAAQGFDGRVPVPRDAAP